MARPSWDEYFLKLAMLASERATCPRLHCGGERDCKRKGKLTMNTFILFGKSGGEVGRFGKSTVKIAVIVKKKNQETGEWDPSVIELTTFSETVVGVMAAAKESGGWITVTGKLSGREYNGKNYLDAIVETAFQHKAKGQAAAPKPPTPPEEDAAPGSDIPW